MGLNRRSSTWAPPDCGAVRLRHGGPHTRRTDESGGGVCADDAGAVDLPDAGMWPAPGGATPSGWGGYGAWDPVENAALRHG